MMKILIVDDEPLARARLRALLEEIGIGEVVGEAGNGREAVNIVSLCHPDIVLLDIRMPGMDGMEAARQMRHISPSPALIFTTAYGDHALDAFDQQAVDYLMKPIRRDRLEGALMRAKTLLNISDDELSETNSFSPIKTKARSHISVKVRDELRMIPVNEIQYCYADQKYVVLHWTQGEALIGETLKELEQEFSGQFLRIHRSTLVAIVQIAGLVKDHEGRHLIKLRTANKTLEVSRRHLPTVRKVLKDMRLPCAI
ncbi:response regulator of the LytR/AlgR family [Beggiatoa alba B18LD]|uniref:Response regulator of the LytR/AlgR family n=1 Tax=Beggiatoa alba B18LD TaxID=395493 RepID=I3CKB0_9GAMM|nr:response regulator [Beggiatoa alba]EIJ44053.1 response regulator of the LytR/AlgR family [Beggiatoa alba B18LD]